MHLTFLTAFQFQYFKEMENSEIVIFVKLNNKYFNTHNNLKTASKTLQKLCPAKKFKLS